MPRPDTTVRLVPLLKSSPEYQDVACRFQATAGGINIQKIERVQNPSLYKGYIAKKMKIDKETGENSERQLFHGTVGEQINQINAQGFNRSYSGYRGESQ